MEEGRKGRKEGRKERGRGGGRREGILTLKGERERRRSPLEPVISHTVPLA